MKTVINKTHRPLKIHLSQKRVLHLGPRKEGRIATQDAERESVKKHVAAGELEILDERAQPPGPRGGGGGGISPDSHGHHPAVGAKKRGDR